MLFFYQIDYVSHLDFDLERNIWNTIDHITDCQYGHDLHSTPGMYRNMPLYKYIPSNAEEGNRLF